MIRLRSLGDCVLTTPALALLKAHRPDLKITVVVEPRFAGVFEGNPDVDEIRIRSTARADLVSESSRRDAQHGADAGLPARRFARDSRIIATASSIPHKIPRAQEILGVNGRVHTAEHMASAMFWLGVPQGPSSAARSWLRTEPAGRSRALRRDSSVCVGAREDWPAERFVEVADTCAIIADSSRCSSPVRTTMSRRFRAFRVVQERAAGASEEPDVGRALFIGNDSGPAHIAAAFGVPVVVLFGSSDPVTWAPWRTESQVLHRAEGIGGISVRRRHRGAGTVKVNAYEGARRGCCATRGRIFPHLSLSVLLMTCVGAAQALTALLIGPIFDRVLNPRRRMRRCCCSPSPSSTTRCISTI